MEGTTTLVAGMESRSLALTAGQIAMIAPDATTMMAGRKLAVARPWQDLGRSDAAIWGECRGSALYQVRVSLPDLATTCSCPSRKRPCKHSLGLLLLAADSPASVPEAEAPPWVAEWLVKRAAAAERRRSPAHAAATAAQTAKRAEQRLARVRAGLDALDLWLCDLMRNGLAELEARPATFWEAQAARLVDAQAPGLAARVRRMAAIPGSAPGWPARLLDQLGRLTLLIEAFARIDSLDPALQDDVRASVGWTLKEDEVIVRGQTVRDHWAVLGQWEEDDERLRTQRTWLYGMRGGRHALVLQFSFGGVPFAEALTPGTRLEADLTFWPGAYPQRALIRARHGEPSRLRQRLPGSPTIDACCAGIAVALARQPWLDRFPCLLTDGTPLPPTGTTALRPAGGEPHHAVNRPWHVRDATGAVLPLVRGDHWTLLALSGGAPLDLAGEWNGEALLPLGAIVSGTYYPLWEAPA